VLASGRSRCQRKVHDGTRYWQLPLAQVKGGWHCITPAVGPKGWQQG
jgi:hypothetical protein